MNLRLHAHRALRLLRVALPALAALLPFAEADAQIGGLIKKKVSQARGPAGTNPTGDVRRQRVRAYPGPHREGPRRKNRGHAPRAEPHRARRDPQEAGKVRSTSAWPQGATRRRGAWCTLTGAARMQVELTVYGEEDRGAWLKAQPDSLRPRPDSVRVGGTCPQAERDTIRADFPSGESGGSPDGQPIAETNPARFFFNGIPRLRTGTFPPDAAQGGWGLRVVRGTP